MKEVQKMKGGLKHEVKSKGEKREVGEMSESYIGIINRHACIHSPVAYPTKV